MAGNGVLGEEAAFARRFLKWKDVKPGHLVAGDIRGPDVSVQGALKAGMAGYLVPLAPFSGSPSHGRFRRSK